MNITQKEESKIILDYSLFDKNDPDTVRKRSYVYYWGFDFHRYACIHCGSTAMVYRAVGGFSPPEYDCDYCHETSCSGKIIPANVEVLNAPIYE